MIRRAPRVAALRTALGTTPTEDSTAQFLRYAIVAGLGYLLALAVYSVELAIGVPAYPAVAVVFALNGLTNFVGVRAWAFPSSGRRARSEFGRFAIVAAVSLVVNYSCFAVLYSVAGLPALVAQAIAIVLAAPVGFVMNRLWSFGGPT